MDAVVQVTQGAQLRLEQDAFPVLLRVPQVFLRIGDKGNQRLAAAFHPGPDLFLGHRLGAVHAGQRQVLPLQQVAQVGLQLFRIEQFARQHGLFLVFIGVERRDSLLGGAELLVFQPQLFQLVQLPVPRQQQRRPVTDHQVFRCHLHALFRQRADLSQQVFGVHGHAVAQDIHDTLAENAGRQQVQRELSELVDYGMPGVSAALEAHDDVILLRQQVHHAAFAFVTPVDSDNRGTSHLLSTPPDFHKERRLHRFRQRRPAFAIVFYPSARAVSMEIQRLYIISLRGPSVPSDPGFRRLQGRNHPVAPRVEFRILHLQLRMAQDMTD